MFHINKSRCWLWLIPLCLVCHLSYLLCHNVEAGSCSKKCKREGNETLERNEPSLCSCKSGCFIYKDCCFDSEFRFTSSNSSARVMCITLSGKAKYKVAASCPANWAGSSTFCRGGVGYLPPVTSKASGVTYANIHCAICNNDAEKLKMWNVYLRCCPEHDELEDQSQRRFVYRNGNLQSVLHNSGSNCLCKYHLQDPRENFTDLLDLRVCKDRTKISKCSTTWMDESVRDSCRSFQEPIFSGDKVYRNVYCAQCNYENLSSFHCWPAVVERMLADGSSMGDIFGFCSENNLPDCLFFFTLMGTGRGRGLPFSRLMNINVQECIPETGKRCCNGQRYDFRSKRCRNTD